MDVSQSMCGFLMEAQEEYNEACCLFRARHDVTAIAKACGLRPNMLRNKLNPEQPHVLSLPEMMATSRAANDYVIVEAVLRKLNLVTAHIPAGEDKESFIKRALNHSIFAGEISQLALDNAGNRTLPRTTRNSIIETAQASIANLMLIINDLDNRSGGTHSFFSMGVDLLTNSAAIPGLS